MEGFVWNDVFTILEAYTFLGIPYQQEAVGSLNCKCVNY